VIKEWVKMQESENDSARIFADSVFQTAV